jgi:hypothetical protein
MLALYRNCLKRTLSRATGLRLRLSLICYGLVLISMINIIYSHNFINHAVEN